MQKNANDYGQLKLSLHGMNDRTQTILSDYLELCCSDIAYIVNDDESEVEIVDIDFFYSQADLEKRIITPPFKPIIVLSINDVLLDKTIYVKKPVAVHSIVKAINTVKKERLKINELDALHKKHSSQKKQPKETTKSKVLDLDKVKKGGEHSNSDEKGVQTGRNSSDTTHLNPKKPTLRARKNDRRKDKIKDRRKIEKKVETREISSVSPKKPTSGVRKKDRKKAESSFPSFVNHLEINQLLDDFLTNAISLDSLISEIAEDFSNNRKSIRYSTHSIKAEIVKKTLIRSKKVIDARILNISSKGALIKIAPEIKLKLKKTVILTIHFDSTHIFVVDALIVRKDKQEFYGLQFSSFQHDLADYLIEGGGKFSII